MKLVSAGNQSVRHPLYRADGTITTGGTAQLVLAQSQSRSLLKIQNTSLGPQYWEFGSGAATATITAGKVTSIAVTNAGFNFSKPPLVRLLGGGGNDGVTANSSYLGLNQPNGAAPSNFATAHCVMTGNAPNMTIASITIDTAGANYLCAPYVQLINSDLDPYGCSVPSNGVGMLLTAGSPPYILNGTCCHTDPVAVFGATTGQSFLCRWMD